MNQQTIEVVVLGNAQGPPTRTTTPPRKPKWHDTINYIGNPDSFCRQNREKYGPCFKTALRSLWGLLKQFKWLLMGT